MAALSLAASLAREMCLPRTLQSASWGAAVRTPRSWIGRSVRAARAERCIEQARPLAAAVRVQ